MIAERRFYGDRSVSFSSAIRRAAASMRPKQITDASASPEVLVKETHQARISKGALRRAGEALVRRSRRLSSAVSFDELLAYVEEILLFPGNKSDGIGKLAAYDTSLRIGYFLGLLPKFIYLHAGVRVGVQRLNIDIRGREKIARTELPKAFQQLSPSECENCICIFYGKVGGAARSRGC